MSIFGTFFVKVKEGGSLHKALNTGEFLSAFLMIIASYFFSRSKNALIPENRFLNFPLAPVVLTYTVLCSPATSCSGRVFV